MKLTLSLYTKVPSKWSKASNITTKKPRLLKENIAVNPNDLELGKGFPGSKIKALQLNNTLYFIKNKSLCLKEHYQESESTIHSQKNTCKSYNDDLLLQPKQKDNLIF